MNEYQAVGSSSLGLAEKLKEAGEIIPFVKFLFLSNWNLFGVAILLCMTDRHRKSISNYWVSQIETSVPQGPKPS